MATTLNDLIGKLDHDRQQQIKARTEQLVLEELALRDLRKAHDLNQAPLAAEPDGTDTGDRDGD